MDRIKRFGVGASFVLVPVAMIFGFASHRNLADLSASTDVEKWVSEFHRNQT
ncbi:hypothetical protein [Mesorhizobium sp. M00.F.Ca.ET.216.01.1.1]|uniref:hypothetical protein n=1 Tax=Mesorhizobium sp. M00.F.Ca.ET.216.01.1.1 TaxID=2500528 RepID=UPI00167B388F|nr:hypothetical protein [Mesorhizobium sp. M00.F.Ca.ET.216.01.1.1]